MIRTGEPAVAMYLPLKNETPYGSGVCGMLSEQEVQALALDFDSIAETPAGNLLKRSRNLWRAGCREMDAFVLENESKNDTEGARSR